jgi:hypothetical protein
MCVLRRASSEDTHSVLSGNVSDNDGQCRQDISSNSNSALETLIEGHFVDIRGMGYLWTFVDIFEICSSSTSGQIGMSTKISALCLVRAGQMKLSKGVIKIGWGSNFCQSGAEACLPQLPPSITQEGHDCYWDS